MNCRSCGGRTEARTSESEGPARWCECPDPPRRRWSEGRTDYDVRDAGTGPMCPTEDACGVCDFLHRGGPALPVGSHAGPNHGYWWKERGGN